MDSLNILSLVNLSADDKQRIMDINGRIDLVDAAGWFNGEISAGWPAMTVQRYLAGNTAGQGTRAERDALLAEAEIIIAGFPFPLDILQRAPKLKWFHQRPAGASNLRRGDIWGSDVLVTTSRGYGDTRAIAEYAIAGLMHFAKGFNQASSDREQREFNHSGYQPVLLNGKTLLVIGAGGIGQEVARHAAAIGMRIIGTRRDPGKEPPAPFEHIGAPGDLPELLARSDAVVAAGAVSAAKSVSA